MTYVLSHRQYLVLKQSLKSDQKIIDYINEVFLNTSIVIETLAGKDGVRENRITRLLIK